MAEPRAAPGEGRMRLTILGGFLGSGKTTWLRHQLHAGQLADAHIIVNEAAEVPVDDALLQGAAGLSVLAGGCACCTGQPALIALLRQLCDQRTRPGAHPNRVVLETSGLADPGPIVAAIRADPMLVHHILLDQVLVMVDARHGLAQLLREPLGRRQVEMADRLILSKLDETDPAAVAGLRATLASLTPGAAQSGAVRGSPLPLPPRDPLAETVPLPPLAGASADPIFPTQLSLSGPVDWTGFTVWLSALLHARGDDVMRVKGVVQTPAGRLLLQSVRKVVQSPELLPPQPGTRPDTDDTIVVIGRGYRAEDLRRSLIRFATGR